GYFFMPADPALIECALRVSEDIPETNILTYGTIESTIDVSVDSISYTREHDWEASEVSSEIDINTATAGESLPIELVDSQSTLAQSYEACINISGYFIQKLMDINGSDLDSYRNRSERFQAPQ
ncbi:hypothetical protein ACCI49_23315, partial [Microbulbifer epialgicus]